MPRAAVRFRHTCPTLTYAAETSTNLRTWTTDGVTLSAPDAEGNSMATVGTGGTSRFIRIVVSQ